MAILVLILRFSVDTLQAQLLIQMGMSQAHPAPPPPTFPVYTGYTL
jgi:hypothetical protein